jgi:hypothetical protein
VPPFALKLYCHWALHVDLTHPKTTLPFLERVDRFAESVLSGNTDVVEEHRMFREFLFLDTFKEQFRQFLKAYDLPVDVCDNENRWHGFLRLYAGIIEDGSLSCEAKNSGLRLANEVTFSKKSAGQKGRIMPFALTWTIGLLDGGSMEVDVNAAFFPNGEKMLIHGVHLRR